MRKDMGGPSDMKAMHNCHGRELRSGMRATKYLYDLGHPLLLGSDTPSAPTFGAQQPGYDTYREMRMMAQSGVPLTGDLPGRHHQQRQTVRPRQRLRHRGSRQRSRTCCC